MINSEKETLESVLSMKVEDARKTVQNEEKRYFTFCSVIIVIIIESDKICKSLKVCRGMNLEDYIFR